MSSDWPILTKLRCKLLRGCYTQATCLATLRKVERRSTFLATRNATIAVAKWGVIREFFSYNLQRNVCCASSCKKIATCNVAFSGTVARDHLYACYWLLTVAQVKEVLLVFDEERVTGFFTPPRSVENDGNVTSLKRTAIIER